MKLSAKQRELLNQIKSEPVYCVSYYKPAKALISLGLARFSEGSWFPKLEITKAGTEEASK